MMIVPNLLVTDDDSAFRRVVCEGLTRRGFQVSEASDGDEALQVIRTRRVHLALVDVHMPRVTGLDLMRQLVDTPDRPACVLMSAELDEQIRREAESMQAYQVLSKPIRLHQLCDVVLGALTDLYGWSPTKPR
ncbi:response regulator receiver protein [Rhodopirellula maiorica SM1]|uniref:Response regulator receiver protein n=1 Tax=Rhodopirellula maiorica SM1 TaxID=1265738 RepID=M5R7H5_9BACT|nr:response regulator [Rhodopirellula maiorica]EMI15325.1 response regulator receiver protein [Rhodopirellula maiorica SM1]